MGTVELAKQLRRARPPADHVHAQRAAAGPDGGERPLLGTQQVTRVRQAEIEARDERDRLNLILENVADPILVTDSLANNVAVELRNFGVFQPRLTKPRFGTTVAERLCTSTTATMKLEPHPCKARMNHPSAT